MTVYKSYNNTDKPNVNVSFKTFFRWQKDRLLKKKDLSFRVPQEENRQISFLQTNRSINSITWIGHATFLIQVNGLNIITDPVWANQMGIEKRLSPPGFKIEELPEVDLVLISHNHYDHLDFKSIKKLPGQPAFFVPMGVRTMFFKRGYKNVKEYTWWQNESMNDTVFTFVPSQHWSKRLIFDTNKTLWGSWMIASKTISVYFIGDSGYFNGFSEIGKRFKPEYFLGPIGCYEPEWLTEYQHMTPEQAIQAFIESKANYFIPMHYDAFRLADDTPKEALDRLTNCWHKLQLSEANLKKMKLGETIICRN